MINQIITLQNNITKSIGYDERNLYVSNLQYGTMESLREQCTNAGSRASLAIPLSMIQKLTHSDGAEAISVFYIKPNGKQRSIYIEGVNSEVAEGFIQALAEISGLNDSHGTAGKKHDYSKHYLSLLGISIFIPVIAWAASLPRTGRRTHLIKLAQDIGPTPILGFGAICIVIVLFQIFRMKIKPSNQTIFKRQ